MRRLSSALAAAFVVVGVLAPAGAASDDRAPLMFAGEWYRARVEAVGYVHLERVLLFRRLWRNAENGPRWLIERRERSSSVGGRKNTYGWIDSRDCDAVTAAMASLDALPPVAITAPRSFPAIPEIPPFHQALFTLETGPMNMGGWPVRVTVTDRSGPVAKWLRGTEEALETCWREGAPTIDGRSIPRGLTELPSAVDQSGGASPPAGSTQPR